MRVVNGTEPRVILVILVIRFVQHFQAAFVDKCADGRVHLLSGEFWAKLLHDVVVAEVLVVRELVAEKDGKNSFLAGGVAVGSGSNPRGNGGVYRGVSDSCRVASPDAGECGRSDCGEFPVPRRPVLSVRAEPPTPRTGVVDGRHSPLEVAPWVVPVVVAVDFRVEGVKGSRDKGIKGLRD